VAQDNIRATVSSLYIEDAVQETTTSTSGVSAEYGRFQGGVINMITKSGGNRFSGSFRANLSNDKWVARTELSGEALDDISTIYEATFGGYIFKDALWFFLAGRDTDFSETRTTNYTLIPYPYSNGETRLEGKLTWSVTADHRIVGSYMDVSEDEVNTDFGTILDLASLYTRQLPASLMSLNYTGVFTQSFFVEAMYSERNFTFEDSGGKFTDVINGTLLLDRSRGSARYHAPTFCGAPECVDEERNNENWYLKGSLFLGSEAFGTHDLVFGVDEFTDIRIQDNRQQGSDYRIYGSSAIILDDNSIYPVFAPDGRINNRQTYYRWTAIFGPPAPSDFKTQSLFANDTWRFNNHWSFNVGLRYDKNKGTDASGVLVANDSRVTPRLGAAWDIKADGSTVINASYSQYTALLANGVANDGSDSGQPAWTLLWYDGPCVNCEAWETGDYSNLVTQDEAIQIWYDWYLANGGDDELPGFSGGSFPGFTPVIEPGTLKSPYVQEISLGVTQRLGNRGLFRVDFVDRDYDDFYISTSEVGRVVDTGYIGEVDQLVYKNDDGNLYSRTYQGIHANFQYRIGDRWDIGAAYTYSKNKGNLDGETSGSGPVTGSLAAYPEYKEAEWNAPSGYLLTDQRNRFRGWVVWDALSTKHHSLSASALFNYETGLNYNADADVDVESFVTNPGYLNPPDEMGYYFLPRGSQNWDDLWSVDLALNYGFTISGIQLFAQFDLLNATNEQGQDGGNTTVNVLEDFNPFTETPVQGTDWDFGSSYGNPTSENSFQTPRTFRFSVGVRF
jgi:outer membrane receptor protein involved in Fe transport